jgi:predicted permease
MLAPALFAGIAIVIGLDATLTLVGVLIFAAPAATNGYIVAKKMGGDADLYADILTWQTFLSLVVLPIWAWLLMGQT